MDLYDRLKVTWKKGHNPDLVISEDFGKVIETIDLSGMTTRQIHDLLIEKGFKKKPSALRSVERR